MRKIGTVLLAAALSFSTQASEPLDLVMMLKIREEGIQRTQVLQTASELCDEVGSRLTGSQSFVQAASWAKTRLSSLGLEKVHLEAFKPCAQGWGFEKAALRMTSPHSAPILAIPRAWTPGTLGVVRGGVVKVKIEKESDFKFYQGKLKGKFVLFDDLSTSASEKMPQLTREDLLQKIRDQFYFHKALLKWLQNEAPLAVMSTTVKSSEGVIFVQGGGSRTKGGVTGPNWVVIGLEDFNQIDRLLQRKRDVQLELDVVTKFEQESPEACSNVLAEIPGADEKLKSEVVMLGAHLDSWHGGTGATDNAAGVSVAMEAMRILKAIDVKPKRTIRIALWGGEEQGLLGSADYVRTHLATRGDIKDEEEPELPWYLVKGAFANPLRFKSDYENLSVYFNVDNGAGRIRGVYAEDNAGAAAVFSEWLAPLRDLGVSRITELGTPGTDHQSFNVVGLPGFQFVQDAMNYETCTHHSNIDTFERLKNGDLMQASVVTAIFAYNAAMREEKIPRRPLVRLKL